MFSLILCTLFWNTLEKELVPISGRRRLKLSFDTRETKGSQDEGIENTELDIFPSNHPQLAFVKEVLIKVVETSGLEGREWEVHLVNAPCKS